MKRIVAGLILLLLAVLSFADTVIYSHSHSGFRTTLTAKSDSVSKVGSVYYYRGLSLAFSLYKYETSGIFTREWWVRVTGTAGTYVSDSATARNVVTVPFTITGNETLTIRIRNNLDGTTDIASFTFRVDPASDTTLPSISISRSDESFWLRGPVTLQATAADEGSGVDENSWQYRLDGGPWQAGSSATVDGDGEVTIEFRVANELGNFGTQSVELEFDKTPPEMTVTEAPPVWTNQDVTLSITSAGDGQSGTDPDYPRVAMTGAQVLDEQKVDGPVSVTVEGTITVTFINQDNAGNAVSVTRTVRLDKTAPTVTVSGPGWARQDVVIDSSLLQSLAAAADPPGLSGLDASSLTYEVSGLGISQPGPFPWSETTTLTGEGAYTLTVRAKDNAGNVGSGTGAIRIDRTAPAITLPAALLPDPVTGQPRWSNQTAFTATAADPLSGLDGSSWQWTAVASATNPGPNPPAAAVWQSGAAAQLAPDAAGGWCIWYRTHDLAGNQAISARGEVRFDRNGPVISIGSGWSSSLAVTASAADAGVGTIDEASWRWSLDGAVWQDGRTAVMPGSGSRPVWFRVADTLGNTNKTQLTVHVDRTQPEIVPTVVTPGVSFDIWTALPFVIVDAAFNDPLSGVASRFYSLDGGRNWQAWSEMPVAISSQGVTELAFRAVDQTGNESVVQRIVKIDRTTPELIPGTLADGYVRDSLSFSAFPQTSDPLSGIDPDSLEGSFSLTDGPWFPLAEPLSIAGLAEGEQCLYLRVRDRAGNVGRYEAGLPFTVDRTPPSISGVAVLAAGAELEESGYAVTDTVEVRIQVVDRYAADRIGRVAGIRWLASTAVLSDPPLPNFTPPGQSILLTGLAAGTHYLYLKAVDEAGNISAAPRVRVIRVDAAAPGAPAIAGLAHPRAAGVEDAVAQRDAVFLVTPTTTGAAGIAGYSYELKAGAYPQSAESVGSGAAGEGRIELVGLADNEAGQFYFLEVRAIGGNGRQSEAAIYPFRVDTTPPRNLQVASSSHSDPQRYYASAVAVFGWNRPLDFSGVKRYLYKAGVTPVLPHPLPEGFAPDGTWTATQDLSLLLDLAAFTSSTAGEVHLAVAAEDYAGNRQFDEIAVHFDIERPRLPATPRVQTDEAARSATVDWAAPTDNLPDGVDRVEVRLAWRPEAGGNYTDLTSWIVKDPLQPREHRFEGLETDHALIYRVTVRVVDRAGNGYPYAQGFSFSGLPVTEPVSTPFSVDLQGYRIWGSYCSDPGQIEANLQIPLSLAFQVDGQRPASVPLPETDFDADGEFQAGYNPDLSYQLVLGGYAFTGTGLSFSRASGLRFDELQLARTLEPGTTATFTYLQVAVSAPPQVLFVPETTSLSAPFSCLSVRPVPGGDPEAAWRFTGTTATGLREAGWLLKNGALDVSPLSGRLPAYVLLPDATHQPLLPVRDVAIAPDGRTREGRFEGEFFLAKGDNLFLVKSALLREDRLVILEAQVIFAEGLAAAPVQLANFSIDLQGDIREEAGFAGSAFSFAHDGLTYAVARLGFRGNDLVVEEGSVAGASGEPLAFSDLTLTREGPAYELPATVPTFAGTFSGFPVTGTNGRLVAEGLHLPEAQITLPEAFGGGTWTIQGLTVSLSEPLVLQPGTGPADFPLAGFYGEGARVRELSLTAAGLLASRVEVSLPAWLAASPAGVEFRDLPLRVDGSMGESAELSAPAELAFTLGGFPLRAAQARFDGSKVLFGSATVLLPDDCQPQEVSFQGLAVTAAAVAVPATLPYPVGLQRDGWYIELADLRLDGTGIAGSGVVQLPGAFSFRTIRFPDFRLLPDGAYTSGPATDELYLRVHGWKVRATGVALDGPRIRIDRTEVLLYPVMGFENLVVPSLVIDSSGQVAACGTGAETVEFLAINGFRVEAQACTFLADGLYLSGKVYFPSALGEQTHAAYDNLEVRLEADGAVITPQTAGPVTYRLAGLDVAAEGFRFDREGLSIRYNTLDLFGTGLKFVVPDVQFYPDGAFKAAGRSFEPFSFRPLGGPIEVGITRLDLNDDGVRLSAFVGLPPGFCAEAIYFDRLTLHPDGRITSDAAIPEFAFELGGIHFTFRNIRFDEAGFAVGEAVLSLPGGDLESVTLRAINLRIKNDGSFELGGISFDPFELWGYTFDIESIGFSGGVVSLEGGIRLPTGFFIEQLAGKRIGIERFQIGLDGQVRDFLVRIEEPLRFPLFDTWALTVEDISISRQFLTVERGSLALPPGLGVASAEVSGLVIDVRTGAIDVGGISIGGFTIGYGGLAFEVDTLTLSSERGLEFRGSVALPPILPSGLAGRRLEVDLFQVRPDGSIGDISASLSGIDTALLDNLFVLQDGAFGLHKSGEELLVRCSGALLLDTRFPQGIGGKRVDIHAFEVDVEDGRIVALDARAQELSFDLFDLSRVEARELAVALDPETERVELSVAGDVLLQAGFPASLQGERVAIERFTIDQAGAIREFAARLPLPGERPLIGSLTLEDADLAAALSPAGGALVFDARGTIVFGADFPQGIAGTRVDIDALRFDSRGNLLDLDIAADFQEPLTLLGSVVVTGGRVALSRYGDKDILVSVGGTVELPASFPQGLAGLPVAIRTFSISSGGQIVEVDIQAGGIHADIWGQLGLVDGSIGVSNNGDELLFAFGGDILLPAGLPHQFSGLRMRVEELVLSSKRGLVAFSAGNVSSLEVELFAGVRIVFDTLMVSDRGLRIGGNLRFPDTFPQGLAGLVINLDNLEMDWDGTVRDIQAGVGQATITLAGFTTRIENLLFTAGGMTVGSCILTLPPYLESKQVGVANASFDRDGRFHGEVILPRFEMKAAGFTLVLEGPSLDPERAEIGFRRVGMVLPDFIGRAQIDLRGVKVGPEGLRVTGGAIRLPDFTIAGGLGFKEVQVSLIMDGSHYAVEGGGKILVPGAGTFGTVLSFIDKSSTHPWGLKRAYFSYEASGLGLPLGSTGLFINGIRGGLAFGPPDEIPQAVRGMFDEGTRLQLGLSLQDASAGNVFQSNADVWVDITDWDWAFQGDVTLLRGLVRGEVVAALTGKGFYGDFMVEMVFARGRVTVYVYQVSRATKVSGSGSVQFGLRQGAILNLRIRLWPFRKYIRILVPPKDWWLASLGAEFGQFKNGTEGFKGYVNAPVWGKVGVFVPRGGGIEFGNVSKYELYTPFGGSSLVRGLLADALPEEGRVTALDEYGGAGTRDVFLFRVPGGPGGGAVRALSSPGLRARAEEEEEPAAAVDRIVFTVAFEDGDPLVTAISPSGARFSEGHPQVLVERAEWGMMMAVLAPEPGEWSVEVDGVINSESYHIEAFGKEVVSEVRVDTPAYGGERAEDSYEVSGRVSGAAAGAPVRIYLSRERDSYVGVPAAETVADGAGSFRVAIDTSGLEDGEYFLYAGTAAGENPESRAYAPGSLVVAHERPLLAVERLIAADNGEGGVAIAFHDPNGGRAQGFRLYVQKPDSGASETIWLGYLTDTVIPGFAPGERVRVSVAAVDADRREGPRSAEVTVTLGEPAPPANAFRVAESLVSLELPIGAAAWRGALRVENDSPRPTGTAGDYLEARVLEAPEGLAVGFDGEVWDIARPVTEVGYALRAAESMAPGTYPVRLLLENRADRSLQQTVELRIRLYYPPVEVGEVLPGEWHTQDGAQLTVLGENFFAGTRLFLDEQELALVDVQPGCLKAPVPAGRPGGTHTLRVIGPGGDEQVRSLTVRAPTYEIVCYKSRSQVPAGQEAQFSFTIRAQDRFSGSAAFRLGEVPPGWPAALDRAGIGDGEPATVRVGVPTGAVPGDYRVEVLSEREDVLALTVTVSERYPDPQIASIEPPGGLPGDEIVLYGYGFGDAGTVRLGGAVMPIVAYGREAIVARVPAGAATGLATVERDGVVSGGYLFYVKNEGFRLLPQAGEVRLQPGESRDVEVAVTGYARAVSLEAGCPSPQVRVTLEPREVVPNALARLRIEAATEVAAGTWPVTLTAAGGGRIVAATVTVTVGEAFAIDTPSLPAAMEGATYRAELSCRQGTAPVRYSLAEGQLPAGLSLSAAGVIGGRPAEVGERRFTVLAEDAEGRQARAAFSIRVEENGWAQADKDGGRSRYNPVPSPADGRRRWISEAFAGAGELLTGRGRVFARTPFEAIGLEAATGALVYRYPAEIVQWAYGAETLFLLERGGVFQALDARYGLPKWRRDGVSRFTTDGSLLLLAAGERTLVLEAAAGRLVRELDLPLPETESCLWQRGELMRLRAGGLDRLAVAGDGTASWQPLYESGAERIAAASADTGGAAVLLESGRLVLLDAEWRVAAEADTGLASAAGAASAAAAQIVLGGERLAVAAGGRLAGYRRAGLAPLYSRAVEAGPVAGAAEKLFVAGATRLAALNGCDGGEIWSREGARVEAALAGERLYGLDAEGRVSAYDGPDNLYPPTTTVAVSPAAPDGENGYYVSLPRVSLQARDPESAVAGTWYVLGEGSEVPYEGPFTLPEGSYSLLAYSADNHGYREPDRVRAFQVDITAPESLLEASGVAGVGGWYVSQVRLRLAAADGGSGVERIEFHLGDGVWRRYSEELVLAAEGEHLVGWRARDYAGNYEPERTAAFLLDLADPTARARTAVEPGLAVVRLEGSDSGSGVERLEYRVDGGPETVYLDPIMLTRAGPHTVAYRAVDRAGRASTWQTVTVEVAPFSRGTWIVGLEFPDWKPGREVVREVREGERMYAPSQGSHNRLERLPACLVGADYIRFHLSDGEHGGEWIARFTAGADLDVYVLKHPLSRADLIGWTLVERAFPVQPKQLFEGGADVYRRSYHKGETVTIPASRMANGKGFGNLAFAQYRLSNYIRIVNPEPGTSLTAGAGVRYAGVVLLAGVERLRWSWRPAGEPGWRPLGEGACGEWPLPAEAAGLQVELRLEAQAPGGGEWDERVETYPLR